MPHQQEKWADEFDKEFAKHISASSPAYKLKYWLKQLLQSSRHQAILEFVERVKAKWPCHGGEKCGVQGCDYERTLSILTQEAKQFD